MDTEIQFREEGKIEKSKITLVNICICLLILSSIYYMGEINNNNNKDEAYTPKEINTKEYITDITYEQLNRTPKDFEGKKVSFIGLVVQTVENEGDECKLRLSLVENPEDIIYCIYPKKIVHKRVLEGDVISIYGISNGIASYKSTSGKYVYIPRISVDKIGFIN